MIGGMNAKHRWLRNGLFSVLVFTSLAGAQVAVPTTPKNFTMRKMGDTSASAGIASPTKPAETVYRMVTYVALTPPRQWKSADGRSLLGKLIAFEDMVVESKNVAPPANEKPVMPATITVVRDGKARLLVDQKPFEVSLDRLGEDEKTFVKNIDAAVKAKAAKQP